MQSAEALILVSGTAVVISNSFLAAFLKKAIWLFWGYDLKRLKPFDCALCLGFWLSFFYSKEISMFSIGYAFTCALSAEIASRLFNLIPVRL